MTWNHVQSKVTSSWPRDMNYKGQKAESCIMSIAHQALFTHTTIIFSTNFFVWFKTRVLTNESLSPHIQIMNVQRKETANGKKWIKKKKQSNGMNLMAWFTNYRKHAALCRPSASPGLGIRCFGLGHFFAGFQMEKFGNAAGPILGWKVQHSPWVWKWRHRHPCSLPDLISHDATTSGESYYCQQLVKWLLLLLFSIAVSCS